MVTQGHRESTEGRGGGRVRAHVCTWLYKRARQEEIETGQRSKGRHEEDKDRKEGMEHSHLYANIPTLDRRVDSVARCRTTSPKMQDAREAKNAAATETQ